MHAVNAKDYVEEMIEGIGYFTADTPVFSVLESDYEPARKITGIPVAEADKILKEITKRIANDDKVESAVARFRIDYVIDWQDIVTRMIHSKFDCISIFILMVKFINISTIFFLKIHECIVTCRKRVLVL